MNNSLVNIPIAVTQVLPLERITLPFWMIPILEYPSKSRKNSFGKAQAGLYEAQLSLVREDLLHISCFRPGNNC